MFKLDGSPDCFLFVKSNATNWTIYSNLNADARYLRAGSAGSDCPAHPRNKVNTRVNINDWSFNKAEEGEDADYEEGGVLVCCTVHDY